MTGIEVWRKSSKSEVKCGDVRWNGTVGNWNGVKPNEGVTKCIWVKFNLLKPNDIYICRTAALTSRSHILNIYSTNIHVEYFKHAA